MSSENLLKSKKLVVLCCEREEKSCRRKADIALILNSPDSKVRIQKVGQLKRIVVDECEQNVRVTLMPAPKFVLIHTKIINFASIQQHILATNKNFA